MEAIKLTPKQVRDWGMSILNTAMHSGDFGHTFHEDNARKYFLMNVDDARPYLSCYNLACSWRGTGHCEWEYLLAAWFLYAVAERDLKGKGPVDLTRIFNSTLHSHNKGDYTPEQVRAKLKPLFTVVYEDDKEVHCTINLPNEG